MLSACEIKTVLVEGVALYLPKGKQLNHCAVKWLCVTVVEMWECDEAFGVSLGETVPSADLGGSSKYSNENFEGRSGEGFHVNSSWTWVSRS